MAWLLLVAALLLVALVFLFAFSRPAKGSRPDFDATELERSVYRRLYGERHDRARPALGDPRAGDVTRPERDGAQREEREAAADRLNRLVASG
jgi:hypothetical protein